MHALGTVQIVCQIRPLVILTRYLYLLVLTHFVSTSLTRRGHTSDIIFLIWFFLSRHSVLCIQLRHWRKHLRCQIKRLSFVSYDTCSWVNSLVPRVLAKMDLRVTHKQQILFGDRFKYYWVVTKYTNEWRQCSDDDVVQWRWWLKSLKNNWRLNTWPFSANCKLKIKHKKERLEYVR